MTVNFQQQIKVTKHSETYTAQSILALTPLIPSFLAPPLVLLPYLSGSAATALCKLQQQINASEMEPTYSRINGAHHLKGLFPEDLPAHTLTHAPNTTASKGETKVSTGYPVLFSPAGPANS